MKSIIYTLVTIVLVFSLHAQPPSKFYTRFGGNGYDYGYDVKQTLDNGYIIVGSTSSFGKGNTDVYVVKLDSMGQKKWESTYGNYNNEVGKSILQLPDSSYIISGYTNSVGFGGYDIYVIKIDKYGQEEWEKTYGGSDWDFSYNIRMTVDGGYIIVGTTYSYGRGSADGYVIKTDVSGNITWTKTYGGALDDEFKSIIQTTDGGYALAGYTKSYNDSNGDAWIFKLDVNGDSLFSLSQGGIYEDFYNAVVQLQSGDLYFSGGNKSLNNNTNSRTWNYCINNLNYSMVWDYVDPGTNDEYYYGVSQGLNGTIASCGVTNNPSTKKDGILDMLKNNFTYLNFLSHGSIDNDDEFYAIDKTSDKGFVVVGRTRGFNANLDDVFIVKTDSIGTITGNITGIETEKNKEIAITSYPNPTSGVINIEKFDEKLYVAEFFNLSGETVYNERINQDYSQIDISFLDEGVYFLKIRDTENRYVYVRKIILIK